MPNQSAKTMTTSARPETELLLCCARTCLDAETIGRIRTLVREQIDWAYLYRTARSHGMMPLLYWHLNATCPESIPKVTLDHLRDHFHANAQGNLFLTGELLTLLKLLEMHGIPAVPYKGPALAASAYGNLSLRQFSDLDILVHKQNVRKARDLLVSQGYRPQFHLSDEQEAAFLELRCEHAFSRSGVIIDLHWAIMPKCFSIAPDTESFWQRLERISLAGRVVPTFGAEDLFLILCLHGAKHCWERLDWICDLAQLIRTYKGMDWRWIIDQASVLGSKRMLFLGLFLANHLLEAALPEEIMKKVNADPQVKLLAAQVSKRLFRDANKRTRLFENHLFYLRSMERLRDRGWYWFEQVVQVVTPTPLEWSLLPLPLYLFPLYYALRPIRLTGKYTSRLIKRFV